MISPPRRGYLPLVRYASPFLYSPVTDVRSNHVRARRKAANIHTGCFRMMRRIPGQMSRRDPCMSFPPLCRCRRALLWTDRRIAHLCSHNTDGRCPMSGTWFRNRHSHGTCRRCHIPYILQIRREVLEVMFCIDMFFSAYINPYFR